VISSRPTFWRSRPTTRSRPSSIPKGPGGQPISIFESGAILKYLATKFGKFYPADPRQQVLVDEWLFWQVGGFGPMLGQNHHFALYAPEKIEYAIKRYRDETHRLYGVLNKQLEGRDYIAGDFSIADLASIGWARGWERQGMDLAEFPNVAAWIDRVSNRPGTKAGLALTVDSGTQVDLTKDDAAKAVLFGQR
jgi:GST-like protein